jgi:hypothetical protein
MAILQEGRIFGLLVLIYIFVSIYYFVNRAAKGKVPMLRRIAGLDVVDEAIGRATEMGRPVFASHGIASLTDSTTGPQTIAGLAVLGYLAEKCAEVGTKLNVPVRRLTVWPIAVEIVETGYKKAGRMEDFDANEQVRFLSSDQFGYSSSYMGWMWREKAAANIMVGAYWAESLQLAETGTRVGALQVAGTAQTSQIAFFVAACDYCLIGEEIYSAGAYLSKDEEMTGSLAGQDMGKLLAIVLIILGTLLVTAGSDILTRLVNY